MSAFVVRKEHIDAMLTSVLGHRSMHWQGETGKPEGGGWCSLDQTSQECMNRIGKMLLAECIRSVSYRYPDDPPGELPGPSPNPKPEDYVWAMPKRVPTAVEALKLLNCYEYQSCEHPEWPDSEGFRFCQIAKALLIRHLPGYAEACWEWSDS